VTACRSTAAIASLAPPGHRNLDTPDIYVDVYDAERPEIFFKATAERTVGPGEAIGVRGDSDWNVPEPELGVVLYRGDTVGYTVGNDVSSRAIEGANPLYLPQAKVYDRCCALGPCVATDVSDPHDLELSMTITRDGETVYEGATSTAEMVRTCEELVSYLTRHNTLPEVTVLLTGTSLVPEDEFTLQPGDGVTIDIEDIGTLSNPVVEV
jgi:2-dehydro-3-deoxy-D-arabinonate dehydratase